MPFNGSFVRHTNNLPTNHLWREHRISFAPGKASDGTNPALSTSPRRLRQRVFQAGCPRRPRRCQRHHVALFIPRWRRPPLRPSPCRSASPTCSGERNAHAHDLIDGRDGVGPGPISEWGGSRRRTPGALNLGICPKREGDRRGLRTGPRTRGGSCAPPVFAKLSHLDRRSVLSSTRIAARACSGIRRRSSGCSHGTA
jgi:hypothetical protein